MEIRGQGYHGRVRLSRGFTLIEPLVVIAITSILAAILLPTFMQAMEKARQVVCASNLRQLAMAISMYAEDYGGLLPYVGYLDTASQWQGNGWLWAELIQPYVMNEGVFSCPTTRGAVSYGMNGLVSGAGSDSVEWPSQTVLLSDYQPLQQWAPWDPGQPAYQIALDVERQDPADPGSPLKDCFTRHQGGAVYAFLDGHVKRLRPNSLKPAAQPGVLGDRPSFWP